MKLKSSKYNIFDTEDNESTVIYNTYSGNMICIDSKAYYYMKNGCFNAIEPNILNELIDGYFLVPDETDEEQMMNELRDKYIEHPKSLLLYLLPTEQCNFRCVYCYERFPNKWMSKKTQDSIIEYVRKNISRFKLLRVEWFGGEPLLALDIIEYMSNAFINICRANKVIYYSVMTTNAYFLDVDTFFRLKKCRVLSYQITVDGSREIHDKQRMLANGGGTYDRIMHNLEGIKTAVKTGTLDVTLRVNVSKRLLPHLVEVIDELKTNILSDQRFKLKLMPVGDYGGEKVRDINDQLCDVYDLKSAIDYCSKIGINMSQNQYHIGGNSCYASRNDSWVIGADGKLYKCTVILYNDENHVGNVGDDGHFEIFQERLDKWIARGREYNAECTDCPKRPLCLESICYKRVLLKQDNTCDSLNDDILKHMRLFRCEMKGNINNGRY